MPICNELPSSWWSPEIGLHLLPRAHISRHVRARTLEVGDLVLRRILSREGLHKLSPMWEGPFKVTHIARPGSARLETVEGVPVGNPWNIAHLQKFYP
jgi:hypothetical protein